MISMKKTNGMSGAVAAALAMILVSPVMADGPSATVSADLTGYEETPLTINSAGSGEFRATIQNGGTVIAYTLTYSDLSTPATQSHIHFGRPAITGQIVLFLCTNVGLPAGVNVPTPPACPGTGGTVSGTLTAADVIARPTQGIGGGASGLAEILEAIRAGAAYANVHSTAFPSGEIRGRIQAEEDNNNQD